MGEGVADKQTLQLRERFDWKCTLFPSDGSIGLLVLPSNLHGDHFQVHHHRSMEPFLSDL